MRIQRLALTPVSNRTMLSEFASKELLIRYGIPFAREHNVHSVEAAIDAAKTLGFPVVVKLCGDKIAHKTERGLVRLGLVDERSVESAAEELLAMSRPDDGDVSLLVAPMIHGQRELIAGMVQDDQFGPVVMLGLGGIFAEVLSDVVFRPLPLKPNDSESMLDEITTKRIFKEFRGSAAIKLRDLDNVITGIEAALQDYPEIISIDINPLIVTDDGSVIAVDALVEMDHVLPRQAYSRSRSDSISDERFGAVFNPRGVVVVGASSHPGKFGFVSLHNILASGFQGGVYGTNLQGEVILGIKTATSIKELPDSVIDLAFICTPASANLDILRDCASKNIRSVFITSAGYSEADEPGRIAEEELLAEADRLGVLLIGPNGQGVVSTPASLCAQIVAPYPPRGHIAIASQSGNFVSGFLNYARQTNVGISRAVSCGNAAQVTVGDLIDFYSRDAETDVTLAYIEGIVDGQALISDMSRAAMAKPLVVVKGGATELGARAAASHTGSLASNDKIFDGICKQMGVSRTATIEEAFDVAATFATQPLPKGPRTVILTTVGGWGVVTSDAIQRDGILTLMDLPKDLESELNSILPTRWSKNNPVDCAGGETRDTVPDALDLLARHPNVDAIIYLGIGIQSNQSRLLREGRFYPGYGLDRIISYHERQDERFAQAAHDVSVRYDKPILTATELTVADPNNAGVRAVRNTGRLCYPSGNRAAIALGFLYRYSKFRGVAQ